MTGRVTVVAALGTTQTIAWASSYYMPAILGAPIAAALHLPAQRVLRPVFWGVIAVRRDRPLGRAADRPPWWSRCSRRLEPGHRRRLDDPRCGARRRGARHCLDGARDRHRHGSLRSGLCCFDLALRPRGTQRDHRNHPDRRLCQHDRLADERHVPARIGLARRLPDLGWAEHAARRPVKLADPFRAMARQPRCRRRQPNCRRPEPPRAAMPILAFFFAATWFVQGAMAAHLPGLLQAAGASSTAAIAAAALVGPAQVGARIVEFGLLRSFHPISSARIASVLHPIGAAFVDRCSGLRHHRVRAVARRRQRHDHDRQGHLAIGIVRAARLRPAQRIAVGAGPDAAVGGAVSVWPAARPGRDRRRSDCRPGFASPLSARCSCCARAAPSRTAPSPVRG